MNLRIPNNRCSHSLLEVIAMQNVMVVRTLRSIDSPLLIFNTEPAVKPSKSGSASEDSAAVILRNQDNSLTKLADSAAGTYFYLQVL